MEMDDNDESQFGVYKDAEKTVEWFLNNAENPNYSTDPDFDETVSIVYYLLFVSTASVIA